MTITVKTGSVKLYLNTDVLVLFTMCLTNTKLHFFYSESSQEYIDFTNMSFYYLYFIYTYKFYQYRRSDIYLHAYFTVTNVIYLVLVLKLFKFFVSQ